MAIPVGTKKKVKNFKGKPEESHGHRKLWKGLTYSWAQRRPYTCGSQGNTYEGLTPSPLADVEPLSKQEMKAKAVLQTAYHVVEGIPEHTHTHTHTHTQPLGKGWETYWCKACKETAF